MGLTKVISVALVLVCFELGFTTCCYHVLTENSDSFTSPNYPNGYPENANCSWLIQTDAISIILTFTDFDLDSCCDFVTIYDGSTKSSPILFDASSKSDSLIVSTSKNVLVTFTSDESYSSSGFELSYSSTWCNHVLTRKLDSFTSPNYPNAYHDNANCSWLIQTDAPIILTFTDFDLDFCCDFVTIYDGSTTSSPILFDASSKSDSLIVSTSKNVLVTFTSDGSDSSSGFELSYSSSDCNQVISSDSGGFGSPRDRRFSTCRWYFNTEKPIVFSFPWFHIQYGDSLEIYDGLTKSSKCLFETGSNRNSPSVIRTTTNQALVIYGSHHDPSSGFMANYSSNQCQDVLLSESGMFTSPNHPLNYPDDVYCRWLIKGNQPISLSFSRFNMADNNDGITIYDGATESSKILYQSFSSKDAVPSSVISSAHEMLIIFSSDGSASSSGFYAIYEPFSCNYVLESDSGWFSSPKYPKNYPYNVKCSWLIKAEKPIVISFLAFDLEKDKDWLTIYDGSSASSKSRLLTTSSNETIPSLIQTSYGQAFITFTSDESGSSSGFNATFESYRCHRVLSSDSGWFSSPNYPKKYLENSNCSWLINSPQPISLSFTQFKTDKYNDWITIYDGPTNSSRLIWKSAFETPSLIQSTTHQLFVTFTSDDYGSDSGFSATYSPSRCQYISSPDSGRITSPNYPKNYPDNSNSCWIINATQPIQLSFNSFHLQANKDWLTVYDGQTTAFQLLNASSKQVPSSVISSSNQMLIIFTSDASKSRSGFNATYEPYRCQYELSASESGWFATPNHPNNYSSNANCSWLISGTNRISLSFLHFDMQNSDDWIKLYDGPTTESPLIFKTTVRSSIPSSVVSTTNQILVVFVSDREQSSSGFNATYSQCQTSENGWFTSPNYPRRYPNNANNCWLINATVPLLIRFPGRFRLQGNRDWLTVYNGPTQSSKQLLKWSFGRNSEIFNEVVTSTSNQILVTFTSDADESYTGFNLTYSPGCTYIHADVQPKWFTSIYYPNNYRNFADDCWLMNSTHPMILSFSRFHLEDDSDWLSVYDGPLITSNQLLNASTNYTIPSSIVSTASQVLVTFTSDSFNNFLGFNATYSNYYPGITERPVECNETIHVNSTGFALTSLNYPSSYPNIRCQWHFFSDPDTRIEISFTDFSTQPDDYVSIFVSKTNSNSNYALLLASGLNNSLPSLSCNHLSVTNLMHVFFNPLSDPSTNQLMPSKAGFRALLSVTSVKECGGSFNQSEGVLLEYQNNTRHLMFSGCVWYIRAETDSHVKLTLSINSGSNKTRAFSYSLKVYEVNLLETDGIFPLNEFDFSSDSQPFSVSSTNNDITVMLNDTTKYDKCRQRDYPRLNLSYQVIDNLA